MTRRSLLAALLLMILAIPALAVPGGNQDAKVDSKEVVAAARAAVAEHSKTEPVELVKIVSAQRQVVAGMNYTLVLKVKSGGAEKDAQVVVWHKLDDSYVLTQWTWK